MTIWENSFCKAVIKNLGDRYLTVIQYQEYDVCTALGSEVPNYVGEHFLCSHAFSFRFYNPDTTIGMMQPNR